LPSGLGAGLFTELYDAAPTDSVSFGLSNLGQDNVSDMVVVKNGSNTEVGKTKWQVANAECQ
jgi:hypothetical protein